MPSNRCSICSQNWPLADDFKVCPQCELPTSPVGNIKSMPKPEAYSLKRHFDFERYYEQWDASHPAERLTTEGLPDYEPPQAELSS